MVSVPSSSNIVVDGGSSFAVEDRSAYLILKIHKAHPQALEPLKPLKPLYRNASNEFPKRGLRFTFPSESPIWARSQKKKKRKEKKRKKINTAEKRFKLVHCKLQALPCTLRKKIRLHYFLSDLENMAAVLVGGAFLSSFLNAVFDRLSSPEVVNWIQGKKVDRRLLRRLKATLCAARALLNDAEQRQIKDRDVKDWLNDLEDAVYAADDLLDEVSTKAVTQKDAGNFWSRYLNLQDREMVTKIEDVVDTLESVVKLKDELGLREIAKENMSWRIPSTSLVERSDIYGRDGDKEAIIKLLLDDTCDARISVIPIVGMGGVGKTTLAQLVYNDDALKGNFDYKAWVCVSEQFDVVKVTKTVIEAITCSSCDQNDLNLLQIDLKEKLTGKKFLVVLDDMWNDHLDDWNILQKPFQYGNRGSKILITTRNEKVAFVMQTIPAYKLRLLTDEDCWLVFLKHAFLSTESGEYSALEQIGRKIVKKCKGLPLAAETLGGLLRTNYDARDWDNISKSEIWEFSEDESRIIPALGISYHYLPSHLKRCFVYCSLYPKDYRFDKDELILLWMAEGLLQPKGTKTLEAIGCKYFDELVARSFFQPFSTDDGLFVMHDLMHDLATFYAGEFYFRAEELENATEIGTRTHHLSHKARSNCPISKLLAACDKMKHLRTFLRINLNLWDAFNVRNAPSILISQLKYLRVLSFSSFLDVDSLPYSIGELIHLRYLDLSCTPIVTLPESLSNLYNLQTLKLDGCSRLKMLPSGIQDLVNLRHLDIRETHLKEMPKGMSKLNHLQLLSDYIVGKREENGVRELGALANLHKSLSIAKLENVINSGEALEARMVDKKHINILHLRWSLDSDSADSQIERDILDKLRPHKDLKELSIKGYRGTLFPDWLGHSSYHNMTQLDLDTCRNCCMLPSLGQLPYLKHLSISSFDGLEIIGPEFYNNNESCWETPFPSLETLEIRRMSCLQVWCSVEFDAFPKLKKLKIIDCPVLMGGLPNHLPALEKLTISECKQLACSLPRAPAILELAILGDNKVRMQELPLSLRSLTIGGCPLVEFAFDTITHTQPTCLQSLCISNCSSTISFPGGCIPTSLQSLQIIGCRNLEFPMQQQHELLQSLLISNSCDSLTAFLLVAFPNLMTLTIRSCEKMKSLVVPSSQDAALSSLRSISISDCASFVSFSTLGMAAPQLEYLTVERCPKIDSFPEGGLPPNLRMLCIIDCEKLVIASMDLHSHSLTHLEIYGAGDSVKSFPKEGCLPASLESLSLRRFPTLETLDCTELLQHTSLKKLIIDDCPNLENMVGERLPASLLQLYINGSPLLGERCQMKDLQIWPKISHIRNIEVDWKRIR